MTINRTFDTVTFWEVKNHKHYVLKGRILKDEIKYLESYMSPNISKEEREKIMKNREFRKAMSMAESMGALDDFKKQNPVIEESESDPDKSEKDDEMQEDSNFTNDIEKIINYSDMD